MTNKFWQWEIDPFFPAAENVQDSADRMESAYRKWLHEQCLAHGSIVPRSDTRNELISAISTAKWQLEDFQRASKDRLLSNKALAKDDASLRHSQFILAIQNQISSIEKILKESNIINGNHNMQSVDLGLNDLEKDDLTSFLLGKGNSASTKEADDYRNNMRSQGILDFASAEGHISESNLVIDDASQPLLHSPCTTDSKVFRTSDQHNRTLQKKEKNRQCLGSVPNLANMVQETGSDSHVVGPPATGGGHKRSASAGADFGSWNINVENNDIGKLSLNISPESSLIESKFWGFLGKLNLWSSNFSKSHMKRWKDGEVSSMDCIRHYQGVKSWFRLNGKHTNYHGLLSNGSSDAKQQNGQNERVCTRSNRVSFLIENGCLYSKVVTALFIISVALLCLYLFHEHHSATPKHHIYSIFML